jgi:hypothetical protein
MFSKDLSNGLINHAKTTPNYSPKWNPNNENKSQRRNVRTEAVECEENLILILIRKNNKNLMNFTVFYII